MGYPFARGDLGARLINGAGLGLRVNVIKNWRWVSHATSDLKR